MVRYDWATTLSPCDVPLWFINYHASLGAPRIHSSHVLARISKAFLGFCSGVAQGYIA